MQQIFIKHLLYARHQKHKTDTVPALVWLRSKGDKAGPLWRPQSEHTLWDNTGPRSSPPPPEVEKGRWRGWRQLPKLTRG